MVVEHQLRCGLHESDDPRHAITPILLGELVERVSQSIVRRGGLPEARAGVLEAQTERRLQNGVGVAQELVETIWPIQCLRRISASRVGAHLAGTVLGSSWSAPFELCRFQTVSGPLLLLVLLDPAMVVKETTGKQENRAR